MKTWKKHKLKQQTKNSNYYLHHVFIGNQTRNELTIYRGALKNNWMSSPHTRTYTYIISNLILSQIFPHRSIKEIAQRNKVSPWAFMRAMSLMHRKNILTRFVRRELKQQQQQRQQ